MKRPGIRLALRTAVLYGIFSALWIVLSDRTLDALVDDPARVSGL